MKDITTKKRGMRLSLKWKVSLIFGFVLFTLHGVLSGVNIMTLNKQFTRQRIESHSRQIKTVNVLVMQSSRLLLQIAETIPLLSESTDNQGTGAISETLDKQWNTLQLAWNLENALYYDQNGTLLMARGNRTSPPDYLIQETLRTETPKSIIHCQQHCFQYLSIPILKNNETNHVLVISKSLADIIIDFKTSTNADIGVLIDNRPDGPASQTRYWGKSLAAISNPKFSTVLLKSAENLGDLKSILENGAYLSHDGRRYEIKGFSLKPDAEPHPPLLVVIDDITTLYDAQNEIFANYLKTSLLTLAAGMIILILLLKTPLQRLRNIAETLPYLAEGAYDKVSRALSSKALNKISRDEIDDLEVTTLKLAEKLKDLQEKVTRRTQLLSQQRKILEEERNFIQELVDIAPLIILTQDASGRIITMNTLGQHLHPDEDAPIVDSYFDYTFIPESQETLIHKRDLNRLRRGEILRLQFDALLHTHDPHPRHISWFHTRLKTQHPDKPTVLSIGLDITDRKIAEERLIWLADHDPLTHLFNRRRFQEEFEKILSASQRYKKQGALLFFDLDQFKFINDTCGHKAGDSLLQLIADRLKHVTRNTDLLARLGGDEFALAIPEIDLEGAKQLAEKVFQSLQSIDFKAGDQKFKITVSIGIAMFPDHGNNIQEILANADLAMYQAKASGRSRIHVFSPDEDFHTKLKNQLYWKDQIEQALAEDRFVLYFQPIMNLLSKTISHYEVLLRLIDQEGKVVPPVNFIPVAEQVGLINKIDALVVEKSIAEHTKHLNQGRNITFSINLSGQALNNLELQTIIKDLLSNKYTDPSLIIFEITETTAVSNFSAAQKMMEAIKKLGCRFAIDDFGVGFSSFYYLMHLPVDFVKIDGSFIKRIIDSKEDQMLVQALADIAQGLGKKTIAEFVESEAILDKLEEFGVNYAQGYYVGKPSPTLMTQVSIES